ncbi:unnamed protein product [Parnassius apollo]|uniref:(apollo) hypothetical protein n=1 Tax=Parnassius apollo TaxID=110799 RepID=A0A8S3W079_PARAO|nr:unnamed protein product [Parnassius apollo]
MYPPISIASVASSDNATDLLAEEDICETEKENDGVTNVNAELPSSSDDEVPLSDIIKRKTVSTALSEIQLIDLCKPGRKNCYNFVYNTPEELSEDELKQNSHLLGTLRKNRKGLPKEILKEKLKKRETCVMENNDGVLGLRWKDKRDVLALSTRHTPGFVNVRSVTMKPTLIADYNHHNCSIDYSDQMGSYSNPARRSLRWFQKLAIELLFSTSLINAFILFKTSKNLTSKNIP